MARTEARTAQPPIDRAASFMSYTKRIEIGGSGGRGEREGVCVSERVPSNMSSHLVSRPCEWQPGKSCSLHVSSSPRRYTTLSAR